MERSTLPTVSYRVEVGSSRPQAEVVVNQRSLVLRAQREDHDAFSTLARTAVGRLGSASCLILRDPELARDAVQEALIKAWRDLPGLRDPDRFEAWLYRLSHRKGSDMNRTVAAAIVVLVFVITGCTTAQSGGGSASPSVATPSVAPTPTTSPVASPAVSSVHDGPLAAGIYRMAQWDTNCSQGQPGCSPSPAHDAVRTTITVPMGWEGVLDTIWLAGKGNGAPDGAGLLVGRGAWLLSEPCTEAGHAVPADLAVGPSVDDFANALADHPLLDVTNPVDVTLAGYSGKYLDLQVPADISKCEDYRPFDPGIYAQGPSHRWHLWILDVDGLRFVVQSTDYSGTSTTHRSELQAIVDSIQIEH